MALKFPSFVKLPKNKQFEFKPRYYDPVKEDIQKRTEKIKAEVNGNYVPGKNISLRRNYRQNYRKAGLKQSGLTFIIATLLTGLIGGYIYFGNIAIYIVFGIFIPFYIYKKIFKS